MGDTKVYTGPFALIVAGILIMIYAFQDPRSYGQYAGAWLALTMAFAIPFVLIGTVWWVWKYRKEGEET